MEFYRRIRNLGLVLAAVGVFSTSAFAQQRIPISDLIQRIDRLETEVVRLRVSPGTGGSDVARLDLIEQELRRLTGQLERLDFETRRADSERSKRLDTLEARLDALEDSGRVASAPARTETAPAFTTDSTFATSQPTRPTNDGIVSEFAPPTETAEVFQPGPTFQPQPDPTFQQQQPFQAQSQPANFQSPDVIYDEGLRLLNIGSFDQAGAQFEDLIATYPEDPKAGQAQFWLGDMHFKLGRFEQAAAAFLDSFRKWPAGSKAPDSLLKLGMTLANIGKTEEACLSFRQVSARYPGASPTLLRRADIEGQRNRCGI